MLMPHIISHNYDSSCSHPLFKKKASGQKKYEINKEDTKQKTPVSDGAVKNAVVGVFLQRRQNKRFSGNNI